MCLNKNVLFSVQIFLEVVIDDDGDDDDDDD